MFQDSGIDPILASYTPMMKGALSQFSQFLSGLLAPWGLISVEHLPNAFSISAACACNQSLSSCGHRHINAIWYQGKLVVPLRRAMIFRNVLLLYESVPEIWSGHDILLPNLWSLLIMIPISIRILTSMTFLPLWRWASMRCSCRHKQWYNHKAHADIQIWYKVVSNPHNYSAQTH